MQELMQEQDISAWGMEMTCLRRQSGEVARGEPRRHVRRDDGLWRTHFMERISSGRYFRGTRADTMCLACKDSPTSLKGDFPSFRHMKEAKCSPTGYGGS